MSLLERMNAGWAPSAEQSNMDILPFIEEQYKLSGDLSKYGTDKIHAQSEQVRFGTVLVRAEKIPKFTEFIKEFVKTEISLREEKKDLSIISYETMMPSIISLIRADKGELVGINNTSVVTSASAQSPKCPIHPHGTHTAAECRSKKTHGKDTKKDKGRKDEKRKSKGKWDKYKPKDDKGEREKKDDRKDDRGYRGGKDRRGGRSGRGSGRGRSYDRKTEYAHDRNSTPTTTRTTLIESNISVLQKSCSMRVLGQTASP
jgi:hypothetical protein